MDINYYILIKHDLYFLYINLFDKNYTLTGEALFDNRDYPGSFVPVKSIQFQTLKPILHKAT